MQRTSKERSGKNIRIKQFAAAILIMVILVAAAMPMQGYAAEYRGNGLAIELTEGSNAYYYTPDGTNMTGEMLESAREDGPLVLEGIYAEDGTLAYSLKITKETVSGENAISDKADKIKETMSAEYAFGDETEGMLAGRTAILISGDSLNNEAYAVKAYVTEDAGYIYTILVIYQKADDNRYLTKAEEQIGTLKLGTDMEPTASPTPEPTVTIPPTPEATTPEVTSTTESLPLETPDDTEQQAGIEIVNLLGNPIMWILVGIVVVIVVLVLLLVIQGRKKKALEQERNELRKLETGMQTNMNNVSFPAVSAQEAWLEDWRGSGLLNQAMEREAAGAYPAQWADRGSIADKEMVEAFQLKKNKDYIFAARMFHACVKHAKDKNIQKIADMQTIECLILSKQYSAALVLIKKVLYKDYDFSMEDRKRLQSMMLILINN